MGDQKIATGCHIGRGLSAVFIALFALASVAYGAGMALSRPVEGLERQVKDQVPLEPYEVRRGRVALAPELLPGAAGGRMGVSKKEGDTVGIGLFPDVALEAALDSVQEYGAGALVLRGKLKGHRISTVVLTIGPEEFLLTVQDLDRARLYRVKGNSREGTGTVTEIDLRKMPPLIR
jgi:hypothetical protein